MGKELQDLLDNYERSIYGKEVPKMPTIHQIHLLLDYIANQGVQLKKQKEVIDKAIEIIEPLTEFDMCTINGKILKKPLEILKEVSE